MLKSTLARYGQEQDDQIVRQEAGLVDTFRKAGMQAPAAGIDSFRKPVLASVPAKFEAKRGKGLWDKIASA